MPILLLSLLLSLVTPPTQAQTSATPLVATLDRDMLTVSGCTGDVYLDRAYIGQGDPLRHASRYPPFDQAYRADMGDTVLCVVGGDVASGAQTLIRGAHQRILPVVSR